jgi:hypothetical protein
LTLAGPVERRRLRNAGLLFAFTAGLGVVAGVVWFLVAPRPQFVAVDGGLVYASDLPNEYVAMDGWFAVIGAVCGLITAGAVLWAARGGRAGLAAILGVAAASVLGSLVAWGVGHLLAPSREGGDSAQAIGTVLSGPLAIEAKGVLLLWPIVALGVILFALAWQGPEHEDEQHGEHEQHGEAEQHGEHGRHEHDGHPAHESAEPATSPGGPPWNGSVGVDGDPGQVDSR